jgi:uncharacterized spore protein YtfJ
MEISEMLENARDALTAKRVYGEPFEKDGLTVIPAAAVAGGAGGGTGHDEKGQQGQGGGFGMAARPAGAYVIKSGTLSWRPAVDVNRVIAVAGMVVAVYLFTRPRMVRAKARVVREARRHHDR